MKISRNLAGARYLALSIAVLSGSVSAAENLDTVSVTATRSERATKDVPEAIAVIDEERLEQSPMFNIKDALNDTPGVLITNTRGSYSARVVIRGAGLKANYGIREIMLIRDGVPITDPDSFTRLDFVDTQDIEQIEVTKGPGNLYSAGSAGGTIQVISKSVFDIEKNTFKLAAGTEGMHNIHARKAWNINDDHAAAITVSRRVADNDWRNHSGFDTTQGSVKHGMFFGENNVWENELSYTEANSYFPGDMDDTDFAEFLATGDQEDNNTAFDHTGRFSKIWFANSRMELDMGSYTLKPKLYYNRYSHYHPVTGGISVTPGSEIFGVDLELVKPHSLFGMSSEFSGGVTYRADINNNSERWGYRDVVTADGSGNPFASRILSTLSDEKGVLLETSDSKTLLHGFFVQESLKLNNRTTLDVGTRVDWATIQQDANEMFTYDYSRGVYKAGAGQVSIDKDFLLLAPKVGLSYKINPTFNAFVSLAQADQVPFANELDDNPNLDKARVRNFEIGVKGRASKWSMDASVYYAKGKDEVVATREFGTSTFNNAGATKKLGAEFAGSFEVSSGLNIGMNYAYSDYTYEDFTEVVFAGRPTTVDRSGNALPFIPVHKYSLFADYRHPSGVTARLSTDSWGEYWMDNANTEKYEGYDFVTNLFVGYQRGAHRISMNIDNLFDERYAAEADKNTSGTRSYDPGTPRTFMLSYRFEFDKK